MGESERGRVNRLVTFGLFLFSVISAASADVAKSKPLVTVGSKTFTESYILGEIIAEVLEQSGEVEVNRKFGMGSTGILAQGLKTGAIDLYPEYSGTISQVLLRDRQLSGIDSIQKKLAAQNLIISESLGFNNTYAIGVRSSVASRLGLSRISDLRKNPDLRLGFTYEFMNRPDGYPALIAAYHLAPSQVRAMEHSLAYEALAQNEIDAMDIYSTDAKIAKLGLTVLRDDLHFFPRYDAVILARGEFVRKYPELWESLRERLEGALSETDMRKLNARADLEKASFATVAHEFLKSPSTAAAPKGDFLLRTRQHLVLVLGSLFYAILIGIPLGAVASQHRKLGQAILAASGILQTIPSVALLCFLIPVFGIGNPPALVALFLYALLPIVANTYLGLTTIDPVMRESEKALGLSTWERLRTVELPLASPSILSGIRTSTVICIGTATLAALIGAGGYGVPIITGLALNDIPTILTGAVPAALLALGAYGLLGVLGRKVIPKGLQKS